MEYFILYIIEYTSIHDWNNQNPFKVSFAQAPITYQKSIQTFWFCSKGLCELDFPNLSLPHTLIFSLITVAWTDHAVKHHCAFAHLFLDSPSFSHFFYLPGEYLFMFQDHPTTTSFLKTFFFISGVIMTYICYALHYTFQHDNFFQSVYALSMAETVSLIFSLYIHGT